jgi:hypothetical protein
LLAWLAAFFLTRVFLSNTSNRSNMSDMPDKSEG